MKKEPFSDVYSVVHFENAHIKYADICITEHGSIDKLADIRGLIQFPCYDIVEACNKYDDYVKIMDEYLVCGVYNICCE